MVKREIDKSLIRIPARRGRTAWGAVLHAVIGVVLVPPFWLLALRAKVPGLGFRAWCVKLGLRALWGRRRLSLYAAFHLLFMPLESTRYFELDFALSAAKARTIRRYLDVSSPRLLPVAIVAADPLVVADLINPNPKDLAETAGFVALVAAEGRCNLHQCLVTDAPFAAQTFDLITSISVLEHIPDDLAAMRKIWDLLKPAGALVLTVPCRATALDQYIDRDEWGLLAESPDGYVFWQRHYDQEMLERNIFSVTGLPTKTVIYGEKVAGFLAENSVQKRTDPKYPYWREPYMMASEFQYFERLERLPGEGVVAFIFEKPA